MKNNSYLIYEVSSYSSEHLLRQIRENKLSLLSLTKVDEYLYHLKIDVGTHRSFLKVFPNAKLVSSRGFYFLVRNRLIQKVTLIALCCGVGFFVFLNTLTYRVTVNGSNQRITSAIYSKLEKNEIRAMKRLPSEEKLEKIRKELLLENEEIENIDCSVRGTTVTLTYYLKEKENHHYMELGKYYAKKNGMIAYADIERGNFLYAPNQYVKEGSLLIDDYLHLEDKSVYVGAFGKVYAHTWSTVELSIVSSGMEESEAYASLTEKARFSLAKSFVDDEKIENEQILNFTYGDTKSSIRIHYTLLENIAVLKKG